MRHLPPGQGRPRESNPFTTVQRFYVFKDGKASSQGILGATIERGRHTVNAHLGAYCVIWSSVFSSIDAPPICHIPQ
jgi:hypothetical protein